MSKRIKIYDQVCVGPDRAHTVPAYPQNSVGAPIRDQTKEATTVLVRPIIRRVENALKEKLCVKFKDLTPNRE